MNDRSLREARHLRLGVSALPNRAKQKLSLLSRWETKDRLVAKASRSDVLDHLPAVARSESQFVVGLGVVTAGIVGYSTKQATD